ncbi:MAG: hypothetical protein HY855_14970 [Burkholderiales bacterium]|nr:hypothetical protein [Burkholderiales bacterium]
MLPIDTPAQQIAAHAVLGFAIVGVLSWQFLEVGRRQGLRWAPPMAAGFGLLALNFGLSVLFPPVEPGLLQLLRLGLLISAAYVCISLGIVRYVGVSALWSRRYMAAVIVLAVGINVAVAAGLAGRAAGVAVQSGTNLSWAVLFGIALAREPRSGHAFNLAAQCLLPVVGGLSMANALPVGMDRSFGVATYAIMGMTLLTTGLVRAQRSARAELLAREQAQAALGELNASLERRVAESTQSLRATIEGLESFNRSVSHDLRGPLGGIAGMADVAIRTLGKGDLPGVERQLRMIASQARTSFQLIDALLALARAADAEIVRREVDTTALVAEVVESLRSSLGVDRLPVGVSALPRVKADPALLRQVFHNLIGNAVKFTAHRPDPRIDVGVEWRGDEVVFVVSDNGVGFDAAQAPSIFKPFVRLHGAGYQGFGVGLSIVQRIVSRHDGQVWAEGRPGAGASLRFSLGPDAVVAVPAPASATPS